MTPEQKDDELQAKTGCRFGEPDCNHPDCRGLSPEPVLSEDAMRSTHD